MHFSKYLLALALSAILTEATEYASITSKETSKRTVPTASTVVHPHETPRTTSKYDDYKHVYDDDDKDKDKDKDKDYDSKTTSHRYEDHDHKSTKSTHETTTTHHEYTKETHTTSLHSIHLQTVHHNTSTVLKTSTKHLMTTTAMMTATHVNKSSVTVMHSESTHMAVNTTMMRSIDTTMMQSKSTDMTFDVFTMSSCTGCIIDNPMTIGLLTASVSAQDFTLGMSAATSVPNMIGATPTSNMQSTLITAMASAAMSAPSAGFATTSRAVFTGSGARESVEYLLAAVLPALVGLSMWI